MLPRPHRLLINLVACASSLVLCPSIANAAPKDKAAMKAFEEAMEEDYFNTQFDQAISRLSGAVKMCGSSDCSPKVLGQLHVAAATIWFAKSQPDKAKEEFILALEADSGAKPLDDYSTDPLRKIFDEAKKEVKPSKPDTKPPPKSGDDDDDDDDDDGKTPTSDLDYEPPEEALVDTPLPIFIKLDKDVGADSAKLRFKPFGGTSWLSTNMKKMGGGFGGVIPCNELTTTGKVRFYIIIKDKEGDPIATVGSMKSPYSTKILNQLEGDQPSLPGEKPPEKCKNKDCPPGMPDDFPGCKKADGTKRGNKGWGASCENTQECKEGFFCLNGSCEQGSDPGGDDDDDDDDDDDADGFHHLISLNFQLDLLTINGTENVCGAETSSGKFQQDLDNYFCFLPDDGGEFLGRPEADKFNEIEGGLGLASGRVLLGYDWVIWKGIAVGARVGMAFGGSPSVGDADERFARCKELNPTNPGICREPLADDFMPFHGEIRGSYYFLPDAFKQRIRPYGFLGIGLGQVNAGVPVAVCDNVDENGSRITSIGSNRCPDDTTRREVDAYQVTGLNFFDFGAGGTFAITDLIGVNAELKFMVMFPTTGFVIAPSVAPVVMF